MLLLRTDK
jgi:bifunctional non-homologous end joining protein LigD